MGLGADVAPTFEVGDDLAGGLLGDAESFSQFGCGRSWSAEGLKRDSVNRAEVCVSGVIEARDKFPQDELKGDAEQECQLRLWG